MGNNFTRVLRLCCTALLAGSLLLGGAATTLAEPPHKGQRADDRGRGDHGDRGGHRERVNRGDRGGNRGGGDYRGRGDHGDRVVRWDGGDRKGHRDGHGDRYYSAPRESYRKHHHDAPRVIYRDIPYQGHHHHHRTRVYRDVLIVRPYGHWYPGYAYFYGDDDAYKWLSFTAIALKLLDNLNEQQQREHEAAQVAATSAPIGERIIWHDGAASGAVTATREGTSSSGRYCREFLQEVSIGGRKEQAYGTACRQPDGAWEMISADGG